MVSQLQLRNISRQLTKRLTEHTRQPITLQLLNRGLNSLTINVNKALKAEENLRLDVVREEKHFKEMMARIIQNLIRNCIQNSDSNIKVHILTKKNAIISFRNFVNGASEIDAEQLFNRFYTNDKARSKTTGLGLSIVKLLAEQMDGCMSASLQNRVLDIRVGLPLYSSIKKVDK